MVCVHIDTRILHFHALEWAVYVIFSSCFGAVIFLSFSLKSLTFSFSVYEWFFTFQLYPFKQGDYCQVGVSISLILYISYIGFDTIDLVKKPYQ